MPQIRLRITGGLPLHGRNPGEVFSVDVGDDGHPVNAQWRKRLIDEDRYKIGAVAIVKDGEPEPKIPLPDVGPLLEAMGMLLDRVSALEQLAADRDARATKLEADVQRTACGLSDLNAQIDKALE